MKKILIIEDDVNLGEPLRSALEMMNYEVMYILNGDDILKELYQFQPDIVLLDVMLNAKLDGFTVGKEIRKLSQVPIIFTTALSELKDMQKGYEIRNVDYLTKPYRLGELLLRINEMLLRYDSADIVYEQTDTYRIGNYEFDASKHILLIGKEKISLRKHECAVLKLLCENKENVQSKKDILNTVWDGEDLKSKEASLDNIMYALRAKLIKDVRVEIRTIPKVGYMLVD